ncbi:tyrosine-protein phosphatase non-receptor type 5 [Hyalella azteca]|uniref:protein-tyrosine-phosphatase n=1 Tax=Hyalella azteca TaxID=294128 RepID=A0A8B7PID0_HYAAZ|nr:tyrosine-protein phosphatase non-receptor type 5 [Hyalella azteca]
MKTPISLIVVTGVAGVIASSIVTKDGAVKHMFGSELPDRGSAPLLSSANSTSPHTREQYSYVTHNQDESGVKGNVRARRRSSQFPAMDTVSSRLPKQKDYSHLEPPLALPSRMDLPQYGNEGVGLDSSSVPPVLKRKASAMQRKLSFKNRKPSEVDDNQEKSSASSYSSSQLTDNDWYGSIEDAYDDANDDPPSPWLDDDDEYDEEPRNFPKQAKSKTEQINPRKFEKMIDHSLNPPSRQKEYLKRLLSSVDPPTMSTVEDPEPIFLPAGKNKNSVIYSSLIDMINIAENLRVKRPSASYDESEEDSRSDVDLSDHDLLNEPEEPTDRGAKRNSEHPQVALVQDRGLSDEPTADDDGDDWALPRMGPWDPADTPVATAVLGSIMLFLILAVVVLALRVHCRNRSKQAQEWIRHPTMTPTPQAPGAVQPLIHHPQQEPIRIKAKGLLERRGSNTSLTLELGPDSLDSLVPSRECTPEDFLLTAGNRLSRRALRESFRDPRLLHAEFWDIPTNHPDRCAVPGSAAKNRYRTVLPNEDTRVVLRTATGEQHPADHYINANYIRGYDGLEKAYIATQGPLVHTAGDLWEMVMQERARAVVMITRLKEKGRVKCEPYIPAYSAQHGSITVTVKQVLEKNGYSIRQILLKKGDVSHTTLHFWFTSWPDHKTPSSARHLLNMATEVHTTRKESEGPVVVHCSAGIGRTGCFIAISIGVQQLLEEGAVDILATVCQMRLDRGGMVQTAEQYEFIHRALALYEASLPNTTSD